MITPPPLLRDATTFRLYLDTEMKNETKRTHAFLLSSGSWSAIGCFYDETGKPTRAEGQVIVLNRGDHWYIRSALRLSDGRIMENTYQVETSNEGSAHWTSQSSLLRKCHGQYQFLGDIILSTFIAGDRRFYGHEILRKVSSSRYSNLGELFFDNQRHSSWSLDLQRDQDAEINQC